MAPPRDLSVRARMMAWLEAAARDGAPCPSNRQIADRFGFSSVSGPVRLIREMEAEGLIRVDRFHQSRRITIVATGRQTGVNGTRKPRAGRYSSKQARSALADLSQAPTARSRPNPEAVRLFDDALAAGLSIEAAAIEAGLPLLEGYRLFHSICAELGEGSR